MQAELNELKNTASEALQGTTSQEQLSEWFRQYLGKKGALTQILKQIGQLPAQERPVMGQAVNELKEYLSNAFEKQQTKVQQEQIQQSIETDNVDITLPGRPCATGHLHLTTQTLRKIFRIFQEMGFQIYEAPEVESDEYNFQMLNIPEYHPARDMWDTFWVNDKVVLRTHTSPGQIRIMQECYPAPIRVILPGKCYRYEQITPRSEHQFYQVEGLVIGENIRMTDLIGVVNEFAKKMFGEERKTRIRGSYFPFTEPSIEIDMDCILCKGEGCRVCKHTGWLEVAGAGMVHPVVLTNGGYSPDKWSGFAFGLGVERPALLKHGIHDIRYFYNNDLNFLRQF
ncbi:MAG: phenylalanine--tRNA ligase subunit alpha [SAR324 cluster bacterium]|nr:phenylalanine--tRNA ligase subunit alpha [SAR324 cluster bacterium]